jgi:hypothetical protein
MHVSDIETALTFLNKVFRPGDSLWNTKRPKPNSDTYRAIGVLALELCERGLEFETIAEHIPGDRTATWLEATAEHVDMLLSRDPVLMKQATRFTEMLEAEIGGTGPDPS